MNDTALVPTQEVHAPRAPHVASDAYHWQRRYGASHRAAYDGVASFDRRDPTNEDSPAMGSIVVFRDGRDDLVEVEFNIGPLTCMRCTVRLDLANLRELAARLLDAAHDIETLPSIALIKANSRAEGEPA